MICTDGNYSGESRQNVPWKNFTENISYNIPNYYVPNSISDIVHLLQQAEEQGVKVKAVGSGWSIENIAVSEDWIIDIRNLENQLTYLIDRESNFISPAVTSNKRAIHLNVDSSLEDYSYFHVEAGIKIFDLNQELSSLDLSMVTLGGAQGQTLAGAISTGTHGGDIDHPPLADLIEAIHLVTGSGVEYWIESSSSPFTDDDNTLLSSLPCPDTKIIRDDQIFNALKVGLGRFGIIYSYIIKVTNSFNVAEYANNVRWVDLKDRMIQALEGSNGVLNKVLSRLHEYFRTSTR